MGYESNATVERVQRLRLSVQGLVISESLEHIRLWPQDTAGMVVTRGTHEMQCLLEHEDMIHSRVFSISELKADSTADLAHVATEIDDPMRLVLRCREIAT